MKSIKLAAIAALLIAGEAFASSTVSDIVARQRWPWNGKVDIDFTITGDTTNVDFMATWDEQSSPVLLGTAYDAAAGQHRFEFDPASIGITNQTLTGFTVTAADPAAHTYLVLDLANGGYSYLADVPAGGWTDEYKSTKMVFRRIPRGTYKNGVSGAALMTMFGDGVGPYSGTNRYGKPAQYMYSHTVEFSSDYYLAVFPMTVAQYSLVENKSSSTDYKIKEISYNTLRGSADAEIYWPQTQYQVTDSSFIQKLRSLANGMLLVDLPTEDQWETAARCGATTVFAEGVNLADSDFVGTSNVLNSTAVWIGNGDTAYVNVGTKNANPWGLYDMLGMSLEWTLNVDIWYVNATTICRLAADGGTDIVGRTYTTYEDKKINRVVRGCSAFVETNPLYYYFPSYRSLRSPTSTTYIAARFCIHLKPLDFNTMKN